MPSAPAEDGPCPRHCGLLGRTSAKALSGSALFAFSCTSEGLRNRPAQAAAAGSLQRERACSFQHARVCLLDESHPEFRYGAESMGT